MEEIVKKIIDYLVRGAASGLKKWLVVIALACLLAALLVGCSTTYRNVTKVIHDEDTIKVEHVVQGRIRK